MRIPSDFLPRYPQRQGRTKEQCVHWSRKKCPTPKCGYRFEHATQVVCAWCDTPRKRCDKDVHDPRDDACERHAARRHYGLHKIVLQKIAREEWESTLDNVRGNHDEVLALAQIALSQAAEVLLGREGDEKLEASKQLLEAIQTYMTIVEKERRASRGDMITLRWDDPFVAQIRTFLRDMRDAMEVAMAERNIPESVRIEVMAQVAHDTSLIQARTLKLKPVEKTVQFAPR